MKFIFQVLKFHEFSCNFECVCNFVTVEREILL